MKNIHGSHVLALGLALVTLPAVARSAGYPTNTCVGAKQAAAGKYCAAVLHAWSVWEHTQDSAKRVTDIQAAAGKLGVRWAKAEAKSLNGGADCASTTTSVAGARALVDGPVATLAATINTGLNLAQSADAKCGANLLKAAGGACAGLLAADGRYVAALASDPNGVARAAGQGAAQAKFDRRWTKAMRRGCPTTADEPDIQGQLVAIDGAVVRDTTVSPNVPDTQFATYPATGPIPYLGRQLNPTCMNGTPYAFFAKRGSVNKLVVYYEGGGACWEQLTCGVPVCDTNVNTVPNTSGSDNPNSTGLGGFFDLSNPANPFRDWNIVFVPYCSCDVHFGDAAQDYNNINPASPLHVEHRGYQNSRAVEKFAREHFVNPDEVFVTGSSAGAYGAWFNAPIHHEVWPASHFDVLADAGNGVITQQFLDDEFPHWNFIANLPPEFPELAQVLQNGTGMVGYTEAVAARFNRTRWAHYATAYDGGLGGQTGFYAVMLGGNNPIAAVTWWTASCAFDAQMRLQAAEQYNEIQPLTGNYRYYIGTGSRHTMWGYNKVYGDTTGGVPTLVSWINGMLDGTPAWTNVECTDCGLLLPGDPEPTPTLVAPFQQDGPDVRVHCSPGGAFLDPAGF